MASAPTLAPSTKETTNYARLCRLLVDGGTKALQYTFDKFHSPANLFNVLKAGSTEHSTLQSIRKRKIINPTQWGKLYPSPPSSVTSEDFDITLLVVLLRNICGLTAPASTLSWDSLPPASDTSVEANIVRVKYYRNTVYAHASESSVDDSTFNTLWQNISAALVALGVGAVAINNLKTNSMDPEIEEYYRQLLKEWKKDEDNIKDKVDELKDIIEQLRDAMGVLNGKLDQTLKKLGTEEEVEFTGLAKDVLEDIKGGIEKVSEKVETLRAVPTKNEVKTMDDILGQIKKELEEIKEKLNDTDGAKKTTKDAAEQYRWYQRVLIAIAGNPLIDGIKRITDVVIKVVLAALAVDELARRMWSVEPYNSILVELHCYTQENFLSLMEELKIGRVKQRLEKEFEKVGCEGELEVTLINEEEVYKAQDQMRSWMAMSKREGEIAAAADVEEDLEQMRKGIEELIDKLNISKAEEKGNEEQGKT